LRSRSKAQVQGPGRLRPKIHEIKVQGPASLRTGVQCAHVLRLNKTEVHDSTWVETEVRPSKVKAEGQQAKLWDPVNFEGWGPLKLRLGVQ
jgi:hypothetical protein